MSEGASQEEVEFHREYCVKFVGPAYTFAVLPPHLLADSLLEDDAVKRFKEEATPVIGFDAAYGDALQVYLHPDGRMMPGDYYPPAEQ